MADRTFVCGPVSWKSSGVCVKHRLCRRRGWIFYRWDGFFWGWFPGIRRHTKWRFFCKRFWIYRVYLRGSRRRFFRRRGLWSLWFPGGIWRGDRSYHHARNRCAGWGWLPSELDLIYQPERCFYRRIKAYVWSWRRVWRQGLCGRIWFQHGFRILLDHSGSGRECTGGIRPSAGNHGTGRRKTECGNVKKRIHRWYPLQYSCLRFCSRRKWLQKSTLYYHRRNRRWQTGLPDPGRTPSWPFRSQDLPAGW